MRKSKILIFILPFFLVSSCFNKIRDFNTFKCPIKVGSNSKLNLLGVYISEDGRPPAYFFYENGLVKTVSLNQLKNVNSKLSLNMKYDFKEFWGHYSIRNNAITIQIFNKHNEEIFKRWILETKANILNDSTIVIYNHKSYWSNVSKENIVEPDKITLSLKKIDKKPDSSYAWFLNKRWYQKNVHESRKQ